MDTIIIVPKNKAIKNRIKASIEIGNVKLYGLGNKNAKIRTGKHLEKHEAYLLDKCFKNHHQYKSYGLHNSYATVPFLI